MRAFIVLARIRVFEIIRQPVGAFWFFALPVLIFGVLAFVFQRGHPFEEKRVVIIGQDDHVVSVLEKTGGVFLTHEDSIESGNARLDSADASAVIDARDSRNAHLIIVVSPKEELFGRGIHDLIGPQSALTVREPAPHGYLRFLYPGLLAQAVVLAGMFGMGHSMARYRQSHFLQKLGTTPLSRAEFVLAQMAARVTLVLVQMTTLIVLGAFTLDLKITTTAIFCVFGATVLGLCAFMGVGFLIAAVVKTETVIVDVINAVSIPIALLSEMFFSTDSMPGSLRAVSSALPSTALVRLYRRALLDGNIATATTTHEFLVLAAWTAITFLLASRSFKFSHA